MTEEPEGLAEWKKELAAAEPKGIKARLENAPLSACCRTAS